MTGHPMTQLSMDELREMMPKGQALGRLGEAIAAGQQQSQAFDRSLDDLAAAKLKSLEIDLAISGEQVQLLETRLENARKQHAILNVQACGLRQYTKPEQFTDDTPY